MENAIEQHTVRIATGREVKRDAAGHPLLDAEGRKIYYAIDEPMLTPSGQLDEDGEPIMVAELMSLISGSIPGLHEDYMNMDNYREEVPIAGSEEVRVRPSSLQQLTRQVIYKFPHGAHRWHPMMHEPNVLYSMRLFDSPVGAALLQRLTPADCRRVEDRHVRGPATPQDFERHHRGDQQRRRARALGRDRGRRH